jgi:hypothetical protein
VAIGKMQNAKCKLDARREKYKTVRDGVAVVQFPFQSNHFEKARATPPPLHAGLKMSVYSPIPIAAPKKSKAKPAAMDVDAAPAPAPAPAKKARAPKKAEDKIAPAPAVDLGAGSKGAGKPRNAPKAADAAPSKAATTTTTPVAASAAKVAKRAQPAKVHGGKVAMLLTTQARGARSRNAVAKKSGSGAPVSTKRMRLVALSHGLTRFKGDTPVKDSKPLPGPLTLVNQAVTDKVAGVVRLAGYYCQCRGAKRITCDDMVHAADKKGIVLYMHFEKGDKHNENQKDTVRSVFAAMDKVKLKSKRKAKAPAAAAAEPQEAN